MVASCRGDLSFRRTARKATLSGSAIRCPGTGLGTCWTGLHLLFKEEAAKLLVIPYEGTRQIRGRVASAEQRLSSEPNPKAQSLSKIAEYAK